jgi:hypothetical protein
MSGRVIVNFQKNPAKLPEISKKNPPKFPDITPPAALPYPIPIAYVLPFTKQYHG